ncbi:MAG: DUF4340 domain-containing protein [Planctomycetota bacterium]|nr:DUF4340 domain-containing protein [Planctomycetota bacterium]
MRLRTTIILFIIAVGLTIYAALVERELTAKEEAGKVFPGLEHREIVKMRVQYHGDDAVSRSGSPSGIVVVERQSEYEWWLREPVDFRGFLPRVEGLVWSLVDMVRLDRLEPGSDAHRRAIPEEGPEMSVRFWTRKGDEHFLEIGRDHPEPELRTVYVRLDGEEVFATPRTVRDAFRVSVTDLRARALFPIAPRDALSVDVRSAGGASDKTLTRPSPDGPWLFGGAGELEGTLADAARVDEFLLQLNGWRVLEFVTDRAGEPGGDDLGKYGLAAPRYRIHGTHVSGREVTLEVGDEFEEHGNRRVYVRHAAQPFVFTASTEPLVGIALEAHELRTAHVFDFHDARVVRIEGRGPEQSLVLRKRQVAQSEKDKGQTATFASESWVVEDSAGEEYPGDRHLIGVAIAELREMMIEEFLPRLAEDDDGSAYRQTVTATLETGQTYTLRIGERSEDPRDRDLGLYRCLRSTDPSHLLVRTLWPERLAQGAHVFHERRISTLNPAAVRAIEVAAGKSVWTLIRWPDRGWALPPGEDTLPGASLDRPLIGELIQSLGQDSFRVREFLPAVLGEQYEILGLGRQTFRERISLTHFEGDHSGFRKLTVGFKATNRGPEVYYARTDRYDVAFFLDRDVPEALHRLVEHLRDITGKP